MKFRIWEPILNEVVGGPDAVQIDEIEAASHAEANKIARQRHPNKSTLRVDNYGEGGNTAIEYNG
jgi:hypothetical protein